MAAGVLLAAQPLAGEEGPGPEAVARLAALEARVSALESRMSDSAAGAPTGDSALLARVELLERRFAERDSAWVLRTPLANPVPGGVLTSGMSRGRLHPILRVVRPHLGIDLAAPAGTPIRAPADGRVVSTFRHRGLGIGLDLHHGAGTVTRYAHLSRVAVESGQAVRRGDVIGYVGSTGLSTGPHLHYEIYVNYKRKDPATYLPGDVPVSTDPYGAGDS